MPMQKSLAPFVENGTPKKRVSVAIPINVQNSLSG
jgi:hypothetical protein